MAITLGLLPQCFSNALHWGQRPWTSDAVYTTKTTVIPESSTVYFVALAFHLILVFVSPQDLYPCLYQDRPVTQAS